METIGKPGFLARDARPGALGLIAISIGLVAAAGGLYVWLTAGWRFWNGPAILAGLFLVGVPLQFAMRDALERRIASVLEPWAASRGLIYQGEAGNPQTTPTLARKGRLHPALVGPIGGDPHGFLAHYMYMIHSGSKSYQAWMTVAVVRFDGREGLRLRLCRTFDSIWGDSFGFFDDWHGFATGSAEVDDQYTIETRDGSDPVQMRELLDPVALTSLIDHELAPLIEIDNGTLLVAFGGRIGIDSGVEDLAWFDRLRDEADRWGRRIQGI